MKQLILASVGFLALSACSQNTTPQPQPVTSGPVGTMKVLGIVQIDVTADESVAPKARWISSGLSGQEVTFLPSNYTFTVRRAQVVDGFDASDDTGSTMRYVSNVVLVKNNNSTALTNLTFVAINSATQQLGGTNLSNVRAIGIGAGNMGANVISANTVKCMRPTHVMNLSSTPLSNLVNVDINPRYADFQLLTLEDKDKINLSVTGFGYSALGYGFVAHTDPSSRLIPAGGTASVGISYKFPRGTDPAMRPYSYSFVFAAVTDSQTTISQSQEEVTDPYGYRLFGRKAVLEAVPGQLVSKVLVPPSSAYLGTATVVPAAHTVTAIDASNTLLSSPLTNCY